MTAPQTKNPSASRWRILAACSLAMLAIANLQYAWTLFTTDLTRSLHASLDAVQWAFTFFVIAQTMLFPLTGYLVDRFGPRIVVAGCAVLVGAGWIGAGMAHSLAALHLAYAIGGVGAVVELGDRMRLPLPCTKAVYACVKLLADAKTKTK